MPSRKRPRSEGQRLYLIFDDWPWGYSIREINLQPAVSPRKRTSPRLRTSPSSASSSSGGKGITIRPRRLPRPFIQVEGLRGYPNYFAAVGTKILATQRRRWDEDSVPDGFLPIIDVRSRGVNFGPGMVCQDVPIFLPIGDELFSLDTMALRALSLKPISCPPRQEDSSSGGIVWSWRELSRPPFQRTHITSYAVHPDEHVILVSTRDDSGEEATFALHTDKFDMVEGEELVWTRLGEWSLPFAGPAHFVHCLDAFVGLSNDPAMLGHLCSSSCDSKAKAAAANDSPPAETQVSATPDKKLEQPPAATDTDSRPPPAWKLGKEKLFSGDPAETHVGATLVHMGGSDFCLVQCVSIGGDGGNATDPDEQVIEELQHKDGVIQHEDTKEEDTNEYDPDKLGELRHKDVIQHKEDANELEEGDRTTDGHGQQQLKKEGGEAPQGCSKRSSHLYHLTTFSLCYDDNGDLTTGNSCRMQCYKVPEEITEQYFLISDPVAFWL